MTPYFIPTKPVHSCSPYISSRIFFLLWRRDPVLQLQFVTPLRVVLLCFATQSLQIALEGCVKVGSCRCMRNTIVFCAEQRNSYWNGCIQAAIVICQQIFSTLALVIFLLKILLKNASKSSFFCFGVEIRFWSCNFRHRCA